MLQPKDINWLNDYKHKTRIYAIYKRPTSDLGTHTNWNWGDGAFFSKEAGIAILISENIDFKINTITRDKEGLYIMIKGSIQEENITIVNNYAPNIGAPQYIRWTLTAIKGEIDSNKILVGNFKIPNSTIDRSSKIKTNKETQALNDTLNKMDLIDIYRTIYPKPTEYTFFLPFFLPFFLSFFLSFFLLSLFLSLTSLLEYNCFTMLC